jgi:hypothetical protein
LDTELIVRIAGGYNLVCAVLHLFFPKMLNWKKDLLTLTKDNRACMKILNLCLMFFWLIFAFIYLFHTKALVDSSLGHSIMGCMILFWIFRIFILQPVYIGIKTKESITMILFFLIGLFLNIIPLAKSI